MTTPERKLPGGYTIRPFQRGYLHEWHIYDPKGRQIAHFRNDKLNSDIDGEKFAAAMQDEAIPLEDILDGEAALESKRLSAGQPRVTLEQLEAEMQGEGTGKVDLVACYVGLLQLPQSKWRVEHQPLYSALRDAVAKHVGMSPEHTQNSCEEIAGLLTTHPHPSASADAMECVREIGRISLSFENQILTLRARNAELMEAISRSIKALKTPAAKQATIECLSDVLASQGDGNGGGRRCF